MKNKALTLFLALLMCFSLCVPAWAALPSEDAAMTDEIYVESASAYGANALNIIEDAGVRQKLLKQMDDMQLELVQVATKSVYVEEGYGEDGEFSSRILTKAEVERLQSADALLAGGVGSSVNKSEDTASRGKLTISLTFLRDARYNYVLTGEASWSPGYDTAATTPFLGDDFMAIRWGGDNEYLKAHTDAFMGMYNDKSRITGYKCVSDAYSGYCWSFEEKSGSKTMDSATAMVMMRTTYPESQNRETGATFTYVHTYEELSVSASVNFGGGNYTGGLTVTGCSKQWQLAVSVDTIKF